MHADNIGGKVRATGAHRRLYVWDPLVRAVHWTVAGGILFNGWFVDGEASLHEKIGYAVAAFVALRLVWGLVGTRPARFRAFRPSLSRAVRHAGEMRCGRVTVHLSHNPLGALMVYNLWASILVLVLTGYLMTTRAFFGVEWVEEAHEILFNWIMLSVVLHIGGVLFDTWRTGVPLVRAMVTGYKKVPEGPRIEVE